MNSSIAIFSGSMVIYWSSIVICMGLLAGMCLALALYTANGGHAAAVLLFMPLALFFSILFCRIMHWDCHMEQYLSFFDAISDYSSGSYCLPGAIGGVLLAALLVHKLRFAPSTGALLDAAAPGAALVVAFIRLSALFNSSCRSKIVFTSPWLRSLPLASAVTNTAGGVDYRFATFFVQFLLMLLLTLVMLKFYGKRRKIPMGSGSSNGNVARIFLLYYSAIELVLDSTRYDSSYMRFNSFVSIVQVISAVCIVGVLVYYSVHSIRYKGFKLRHVMLWLGFLLSVGIVGMSEYFVQRYGNMYLPCYTVMSLGSILMVTLVYNMYSSCCIKNKRKEKNNE